MKESNIQLSIPRSVYADEYYKTVISVFEEMLDELKSNVKVPIDYIKLEDKETLLNIAKSNGVETIFKRLPIERGRQLLNEFPYLIRGKGSSEAIERMAQIYLGVVGCKVVDYDRLDKSYSLELVYGELAGLSSYYLETLYDAIIYVNPIGRILRGFSTSIEPYKLDAIRRVEPEVYVKTQSLLGYPIENINRMKIEDIKGFVIRPKEVREDLLGIYGEVIINEL